MTAGAENRGEPKGSPQCKKCGHIGGHLIPEPEESIHNARIVCSDCGAFIKWAGKEKKNLEELGRWAVYEKDWCFNFGKYTGQTIREVMASDRGLSWCKWVIGNQTDFSEKCPSLVDLIQEIAEEEGVNLGV